MLVKQISSGFFGFIFVFVGLSTIFAGSDLTFGLRLVIDFKVKPRRQVCSDVRFSLPVEVSNVSKYI